jgi:hypothetical protein
MTPTIKFAYISSKQPWATYSNILIFWIIISHTTPPYMAINIDTMPNDCVSKILSYTSPIDVCRFSMVSSTLYSAANSDSIWKTFLPSDYDDILSRTINPFTLQSCSSYKNLFYSLCQHPLLIDRGRIVSIIIYELGRKSLTL